MDIGLKAMPDDNENNNSNRHVLKPYCVLPSVVDNGLEMAVELNLSNLKGQEVMIPAKL